MSNGMDFSPQLSLRSLIHGQGVLEATSPSVVDQDGDLYVFWVGTGGNGIWYSVESSGDWATQENVTTAEGILSGTSPASATYQGKIYLFWVGAGGDGIWYSTFDGSTWSTQTHVTSAQGVLGNTSPALCSYNGQLYLFWVGAGGDGIWYSTFDGSAWSTQTHVTSAQGVLGNSSPALCTDNDQLYLFWVGAGKDGIWYSSFDGSSWSSQQQVGSAGGVMDSTSPACSYDVSRGEIMLFWTGSGNDGLFCSFLSGGVWTDQESMAENMNGQGVQTGTSPAVTLSNFQPYVFWTGSGGDGTWFTRELTFDDGDDSHLQAALNATFDGKSFWITDSSASDFSTWDQIFGLADDPEQLGLEDQPSAARSLGQGGQPNRSWLDKFANSANVKLLIIGTVGVILYALSKNYAVTYVETRSGRYFNFSPPR